MTASTSTNPRQDLDREKDALAEDLRFFGQNFSSRTEMVEMQLIPGAKAEIDAYGEGVKVSNHNKTGHYHMTTVINHGLAIARKLDETGCYAPASS